MRCISKLSKLTFPWWLVIVNMFCFLILIFTSHLYFYGWELFIRIHGPFIWLDVTVYFQCSALTSVLIPRFPLLLGNWHTLFIFLLKPTFSSALICLALNYDWGHILDRNFSKIPFPSPTFHMYLSWTILHTTALSWLFTYSSCWVLKFLGIEHIC